MNNDDGADGGVRSGSSTEARWSCLPGVCLASRGWQMSSKSHVRSNPLEFLGYAMIEPTRNTAAKRLGYRRLNPIRSNKYPLFPYLCWPNPIQFSTCRSQTRKWRYGKSSDVVRWCSSGTNFAGEFLRHVWLPKGFFVGALWLKVFFWSHSLPKYFWCCQNGSNTLQFQHDLGVKNWPPGIVLQSVLYSTPPFHMQNRPEKPWLGGWDGSLYPVQISLQFNDI